MKSVFSNYKCVMTVCSGNHKMVLEPGLNKVDGKVLDELKKDKRVEAMYKEKMLEDVSAQKAKKQEKNQEPKKK